MESHEDVLRHEKSLPTSTSAQPSIEPKVKGVMFKSDRHKNKTKMELTIQKTKKLSFKDTTKPEGYKKHITVGNRSLYRRWWSIFLYQSVQNKPNKK